MELGVKIDTLGYSGSSVKLQAYEMGRGTQECIKVPCLKYISEYA